jgi:hypothetical protein
MVHMNTTSAPSNIRLTITVSPEVHDTFQRMAKAGGMSLSRCMGDWLADTVEAAAFTAQKMEEARAAPRLVAREIHSYALGLVDETTDFLESVRKGRRPAASAHGKRSATADREAADSFPPSCNTGGKVPPSKGKGGRS